MDYEATDRHALQQALLALKVCPEDRSDLQPVALCEDVYGCLTCNETWHIPQEPSDHE